MSTTIPGFTATTPTASTTTANGTSSGLNSLSSADFMKLMFTQLEQQDPLNPTDSNQMLSQISQISTLQSNTQMETSLQGLTLQQSIGAGGNLIGKSVKGNASNGTQVSGNVTSVQVQNNVVYLGLDGNVTLPMSNVISISTPKPATSTVTPTPAATATTTAASSAASLLPNILSALTGA